MRVNLRILNCTRSWGCEGIVYIWRRLQDRRRDLGGSNVLIDENSVYFPSSSLLMDPKMEQVCSSPYTHTTAATSS